MTLNNNDHIKDITLTTNKSDSWEVPIAVFIIIIGIMSSIWVHYLAAAINLFGLWIFIKYNLGSRNFMQKFFRTQKIDLKIFQSESTSESKKNLLLLLPKHFYTNTNSSGFITFFKYAQFAYIFITGLSILWLYSKDIMTNKMMYFSGNALLLIIQFSFLTLYFIFQTRLKKEDHKYDFTQITDTLQEVPNLHILQKPKFGKLSAMHNFIEDNDYNLTPQNTVVLNISDITSHHFSIINGEGVIVFHQYENQIITKALKTGIPVNENKIYPSAMMPFINTGFTGFSITFSDKQQSNTEKLSEILKY